jgi:NarL family two-component system response regulator LiaR
MMSMSETEIIKVMIVDDHPIVRNGLEASLLADKGLELFGKAKSGVEALALCQESTPDVILMDLVMPDMDGLETTRAILDCHPQVKIIVLTSFPEEDLVQRALDAGAISYLLKNVPISTLSNAIRSAYSGESTLSPEATQALVQSRSKSQNLGDDLSERERQVLALIVKGLSNEEIADQLVISPYTVKNHVSACISKLGANNRTQAATIAIENSIISKS